MFVSLDKETVRKNVCIEPWSEHHHYLVVLISDGRNGQRHGHLPTPSFVPNPFVSCCSRVFRLLFFDSRQTSHVPPRTRIISHATHTQFGMTSLMLLDATLSQVSSHSVPISYSPPRSLLLQSHCCPAMLGVGPLIGARCSTCAGVYVIVRKATAAETS